MSGLAVVSCTMVSARMNPPALVRGRAGMSCLHHAVVWDNEAQASALVEAGADVNLATKRKNCINKVDVESGVTPFLLSQQCAWSTGGTWTAFAGLAANKIHVNRRTVG